MTDQCAKCRRFLSKSETFLCEACEKLFSEWLDRNFRRVSRMKVAIKSPLETWLEELEHETKEKDE